MEIQQIIEKLLKKIVSEPDQVKITGSEKDKVFVFKARVAQADMGKVIGKKGKNCGSYKNHYQCFWCQTK